MPIELPVFWIVLLNVVGWPVIQVGLAWGFTRLPVAWFDPPDARTWERGGLFYERAFAIKRWKDRLPDAASWMGGGFAKGTLAGSDPNYLRRFICETWRGELCHWFALGFTPLFFLWNPWWGDAVIVAYAIAANLPCILAQRYNRLRLRKLLARIRTSPGLPQSACTRGRNR
jgi:glycosyl-4,4'-diaponeurosporenoate acyltransferase